MTNCHSEQKDLMIYIGSTLQAAYPLPTDNATPPRPTPDEPDEEEQ